VTAAGYCQVLEIQVPSIVRLEQPQVGDGHDGEGGLAVRSHDPARTVLNGASSLGLPGAEFIRGDELDHGVVSRLGFLDYACGPTGGRSKNSVTHTSNWHV
jgi:hypothetical protein